MTPTVHDGHVQLRGQVRNPFQRDAAEFFVSRLDGVLAIENLIAISSEPIPSDVADCVNQAFKRNAIIDESKIKVSNDGHTIYLTGVVGSYAAMREALDTAVASARRRQRRERPRDRAIAGGSRRACRPAERWARRPWRSSRPSATVAEVLVDREGERAAIDRPLDGARRGSSGVLVLRGPAGIGKKMHA